jgi:hypothetical protein
MWRQRPREQDRHREGERLLAGWDAEPTLSERDEKSWFSETGLDQWTYDEFKTQRVEPTHCLLQSDPETMNPEEWKVEVSSDCSSWRKQHNDTNAGVQKTFSISCADDIRGIRLR